MAYDQELADVEAALKRWYEAASPYATPEALKEALSRYVGGDTGPKFTEADARAIAILRELADSEPVRRWKEFEDRGEERIPCFIQVETAKKLSQS